VQMDDGTPPPESVVVERVCQGYVRPEAHTDSKGHFSFQLGANNAMVADASMSTYDPLNPNGSIPGNQTRGVDQRALMGCELRASLPGFRSDVVNLMSRRSMDNPDVGVIVLHRMGDVEGLTISVTSSLAPKDAKKAYDKGKEALAKNKPEEAEKQLSKAVELYPKYATAWYELGRAHMALQKNDVARTDFQHALDADSKFVSPYESLAQMAASENKWKDVADITDRILRLNPVDFPQSYYYNAVANLNLRNLDAAEKSANELIKRDLGKVNPKVYHIIGLIQAQKGQWSDAATNLHKYIDEAKAGAGVDLAQKQLAEIEKMAAGPAKPAAATEKP